MGREFDGRMFPDDPVTIVPVYDHAFPCDDGVNNDPIRHDIALQLHEFFFC